jgi:hypothetical protein
MATQPAHQAMETTVRDAGAFPPRVSVLLTGCVVGLAGASIAIGGVEARYAALLTWVLVALVTIACVFRPRFALPAGVAGAAIFDGLVLYQHVASHASGRPQLAASIILTSLTLLVLGVALHILMRELGTAFERSPGLPAGDGSLQDETTGAYRSSYLPRLLAEEVERGRRSKRSFTVCLVGTDDWR